MAGRVLANQPVSFNMFILKGNNPEIILYTEEHQGKITNEFGLIELSVGQGTEQTGNFPAIPWESDNLFLKVQMDPKGGSGCQTMGTSQLLSVPYALFSEKAGNGFSGN